MYLHGHFYNQKEERIEVHILTGGDRTKEIVIGDEDGDLSFSADPVDLTSQVNDTFDHLLCQQATVRLLARNFVPDFFCASCRDAVVNIYREGKCLFAGFVEPQSYSQGYNEELDEIELSCIDALTALQYAKYRDVGSLGVVYGVVKSESVERSFSELLLEILCGVMSSIDILGGHSVGILYDGSKSIDGELGNAYKIFEQMSLSELLFLGDDEDDVWSQSDVVEELLKYLNLHVVQDGLRFYIYSWETLRLSSGEIVWHDIMTGESLETKRRRVVLSMANVADCDTTISIGEVYNKLLLKANVASIESVVESPLEDEMLESPYVNKQKYITEYSSDGNSKKSFAAFKAMIYDHYTDYGEGSMTDWYVQIMRNKHWTFPMNGNVGVDLVEKFCGDGRNQHSLPLWLGKECGACVMSLGSVKKNTAKGDNSPTSKVEMTNYLVVSVNGNGIDKEGSTYPNESVIKRNIPCAVYTGNSVGGVFSPADEATTNYIVLSGSLVLNPIMSTTAEYSVMRKTDEESYLWYPGYIQDPGKDQPSWWMSWVASRNNKNGRYYTRKYWQAETPNMEATWDSNGDKGFYPYSGDGPEEYEFKYSAVGEKGDKISKVGVLACMLIIGNKCVVEKTPENDQGDRDESGTPIPYTSDPGEAYKNFVWKPYKEREQCVSDDEYYQQSFTIGFDPKIGDKIIGQEYSLQKTFSTAVGIDAEGIGIRIRKKDKVSGQVRFMILGPVNSTWDVITRRHPTFFRHTKWSKSSVPLLAHVSSIMMKSFEVKVYSDNGLISKGNEGSDIIYMSDTKERYVNVKDDLEFRINSALTSEECQQLGVSNTVKLSTPLNMQTGDGVLEVYDRTKYIKAKPEQLYVDSYYTEYHKPRIVMEQKVTDSDDVAGLFHRYRHEALKKDFYVVGISRNLEEGRADLTLKEINI